MIPRVRTLGLLWATLATLGCPKGDAPEPAADPAPAAVRPAKPQASAAWGDTLAELPRALSMAELARSLEGRDAARGPAEAWAVGRVGEGAAQTQLLALLDGDAKATSAQLAAIGFLEPPASDDGPAALEDAVWTRLAVTEDPAEIRALMFAVARIGTSASQQRLAASLDPDAWAVDAERSRTTLEVVGMLCARGHAATLPTLQAIGSALEDAAPLATAAAYAIGRCAGPSAELLAGPVRGRLVERIEPLLSSPEPEVARRAWKAIGALGEMPASTPAAVLAAGASSMPWQVEVEAARALAGHADGRGMLAARLATSNVADWSGPRIHVALESLRGLRDAVAGAPELVTALRPWADALRRERSGATQRRVKELALLDCELMVLEAVVSGDHGALSRCATGVPALPGHFADVLVVEAALRSTVRPAADTLFSLAADTRPPVAAAAIAALVDSDDARTAQTLRDALTRKDTGVRAAAATAIATRSMDRARRDASAAASLSTAISTWPNSTAIEARIAAITALGNLARSRPAGEAVPTWLSATLTPLLADPAIAVRQAAAAALKSVPGAAVAEPAVPQTARFDPTTATRLESLGSDVRGLRLTTSAGDISIAFEGASPINQAALASLTEEGFFDGLSFHRVVPGFVVQGGDPHGDGYGGPGFLLPCERSNLEYQRGVVGMALAGKDTGGSQFFIAQGREPRLDGRYTIVGRVEEGLDVVDQLLPHDLILDAELMRAP